MNVGSHQLAQRFIYELVSVYPAAVAERVGDDDDFKMTAAIFCSSVSGMQMALILNQYLVR